ncbi:MAG: Ig-like domain-containing protein [Longimicrobiales bacterium]
MMRTSARAATTAAALAFSMLVPLGASGQDAAVARLVATPASVVVTSGASVPLSVRAVDASGGTVDVPVRVVGARNGVRIDDGTVTGLEPGEYEIFATAVLGAGIEPVQLRIPVVVEWPAVTEVSVAAEDGRLWRGATLRHTASATHADGSVRPDPTVTWRTSDPSVATVDAFGNVTAVGEGPVRVTATVEGASGSVEHGVATFPGSTLTLEGGAETASTGDVLRFRAVVRDAAGRVLPDVPVTWSTRYEPTSGMVGNQAPGQIRDGAFVADLPGIHTVLATAGPLSARTSLKAEPRDVVQPLEVTGHNLEHWYRTTDLWVFEGTDGRDYALTGSKVSGGFAFLYDVTNPAAIAKIDSVHVDARTVNDVKVSPDGRYAVLSREGATNRRNGLVVLDLAVPSRPVVASVYEDGITGGVHNMFATDDYLYALSDGDKYVIVDMTDLYSPRYVSEYNHPDSRIHDVWVHDGLAYSAEWGSGVVVVDVGNGKWGGSPENPVLVTSFNTTSDRTHAVFPYFQEATGKTYLFVGDEIMNRDGLAWAGYPGSMGSYSSRYDPDTGTGGIPLVTRGTIQIVDFTDPMNPVQVGRYEVPEYGTHNIWVEDDKLYQAYYEGGLRVVDVSGELMGNLYTQGREIAVFKSASPVGYTPNATMVWGAQPHKGHVFFADTNSGLWSVRLLPKERPIS